MDRENNFVIQLNDFIESLDEDYLIGVSNKGTVNRSKKDLEKADSIVYDIQDDKIEFKIDDITCSVSFEIHKYKCSCPSRSICKHVIMCYLYMMNNREKIFGIYGANENETNEDNMSKSNLNDELSKSDETENSSSTSKRKKEFLKIKEYSIEDIKKEIGEKKLIEIIRKLNFGIDSIVEETSIITVDFGEDHVIVKLLDEIENCVCTCKSKDLCIHKAEAIILYKIYKGWLSLEDLNEYINIHNYVDEEMIKKAGKEIRNLLEEILISGISRIPETMMDNINNMALKCHNYDLPNFEKNLRRIKEEISLYFRKNSAFDNVKLMNIITDLYGKTITLENTKDMNKITEIIGEFKSSYYNIPAIELNGIGAEKWTSKSGYKGITYYFFENRRNSIFTFTKSIATYYDNESRRGISSSNVAAPWNMHCSINELSKIRFKLFGGKINSQNRISSSSESKGVIIDRSKITDLNIKKYIFDNWNEIINKIFINKENYNVVFIKGYSFGQSDFNNIEQKFIMEIKDEEDNILEIDIQFSLESKSTIKALEEIYKRGKVPLFFGRVYIKNGKIGFHPIAYYKDNEVVNLS